MVEHCIQWNGLRVCDQRSAGPELVGQPGGLAGVVRRGAAARSCTWRAEGDGVQPLTGALGDLHPGGQLRHRGEPLGHHVVDPEVEVDHGRSGPTLRQAQGAAWAWPARRPWRRSRRSPSARPGRRRSHARPYAAGRPVRSRRRSAPGSTRRSIVVGAADQQGLDVGREDVELRIGGHDVGPGAQPQLGLGHPGGTRIEGTHPPGHRAGEEERQPDRDVEGVPAGRGQREVGEGQIAIGHRPVAQVRSLGGEQQPAAPAGAHQPPALDVDDVRMVVADRFGAHVAGLAVRGTAAVGW